MATLTIKNIPDALYDQLKQSAESHRRSINSEVLICLERTLGNPRVDVDKSLAHIRNLRNRSATFGLNDVTLAKAKRRGRP